MAMVSSAANMEQPWAVTVKNTFITVAGDDGEASTGRSSSLPPSLRLAASGGDSSPTASSQRRLRAGRRGRAGAKAVGEEDASTEADSLPAEEDASTEAGNSVEEEQSTADAEAMLELEQPGTSNLAVGEGSAKPEGALAQVICGPVGHPSTGTQRLNSAAQAWTPSAALTSAPSESGRRFHLQLERIIQAARSILLGCACVVAVEPTRAACGWSVAVRIRKEEFHCKELVLTHAKEAFLMAAEASENVYVLGYLARPFVASLVGFSARFAAVQDDHNACWGLLKTGCCQFGNKCRWQHPECQATVSVLALLAVEP